MEIAIPKPLSLKDPEKSTTSAITFITVSFLSPWFHRQQLAVF